MTSEAHRRANKKYRLSAKGKEMARLAHERYRVTTKGKDAILRRTLRLRYGITPEQRENMMIKQDGVCAGCLRPERATSKNGRLIALAVHHCKKTGHVICLLCKGCNTSLGHFNDDPREIIKMAQLLLTIP